MIRANKNHDMTKAIKWIDELEEKVKAEKELAEWYIKRTYGSVNTVVYSIYRNMVCITNLKGERVYVFLDKIKRMMKEEEGNELPITRRK